LLLCTFWINDYTDHGSLAISAGVDSNRVEQGIKGILDEMKKIRDEKVSDTELRKAKDFLIGNMYLGLESSDDLASFYGYQEYIERENKTPKKWRLKLKKLLLPISPKWPKRSLQTKNSIWL